MNQAKKRRNTKIVATIGPASRSPEKLESLIKAGANVFRLNFSHGTHEEHLEVFNRIREASEKLQMPVAILQDLSGPKIRISDVDENNRDLADNASISLKLADGSVSNSSLVFLT